MGKCTGNLYQSGERVSTTGIYEVIGTNHAPAVQKQESAVRHFQRGELFPAYDGWEVCWRLCDKPAGSNLKEHSESGSGESRRSH